MVITKKCVRIVHVILSELYVTFFLDCFVKDLMFCFSIDKDNKLFPRPPKSVPGECPIKLWLKYILEDLQIEQIEQIRKIKELMTNLHEFCLKEKKTIWLIIDEENVFERNKTLFSKEVKEFKKEFLNSKFFHVIVHGFSENDENISLLKKNTPESQLYLNFFFKENEVKQFLLS